MIQNDQNDGGVLNVQGTPTVFINGVLYKGSFSYEALKSTVDEKLK